MEVSNVNETFYVASYGKGDKRGVYIVNMDKETLHLELLEHILTPDFPSYMITTPHTLYISYKNARSTRDKLLSRLFILLTSIDCIDLISPRHFRNVSSVYGLIIIPTCNEVVFI